MRKSSVKPTRPCRLLTSTCCWSKSTKLNAPLRTDIAEIAEISMSLVPVLISPVASGRPALVMMMPLMPKRVNRLSMHVSAGLKLVKFRTGRVFGREITGASAGLAQPASSISAPASQQPAAFLIMLSYPSWAQGGTGSPLERRLSAAGAEIELAAEVDDVLRRDDDLAPRVAAIDEHALWAALLLPVSSAFFASSSTWFWIANSWALALLTLTWPAGGR